MKNIAKFAVVFLALILSFSAKAQFDDVYYDDTETYPTNNNTTDNSSNYVEPDKSETYYDENVDTYITNKYYEHEYEEEDCDD